MDSATRTVNLVGIVLFSEIVTVPLIVTRSPMLANAVSETESQVTG